MPLRNSNETTKACRLCGSVGPLRESHIVSKFVVRHLTATSKTAFLRTIERPNVRVQDAFKIPLLCEECEQRFSRWENSVAGSVFKPLRIDSNGPVAYGSDFSRFAVSVLWRVSVFRSDAFLNVSPEFKRHLEAAEQGWRNFLLGKTTTPGIGPCHTVLLGTKLVFPLPVETTISRDRFQRYLDQTIDINLVSDGRREAYAYAKLSRLLLFGFLEPPSDNVYRPSRIGLRKGVLGPGAYQLPTGIVGALISNAQRTFSAVGSLSVKQKAKINEGIHKCGGSQKY